MSEIPTAEKKTITFIICVMRKICLLCQHFITVTDLLSDSGGSSLDATKCVIILYYPFINPIQSNPIHSKRIGT